MSVFLFEEELTGSGFERVYLTTVQLQAEQVAGAVEGQFLVSGGMQMTGAADFLPPAPPLTWLRSWLLRLEMVILFKLSLLIVFFMVFVFLSVYLIVSCCYR